MNKNHFFLTIDFQLFLQNSQRHYFSLKSDIQTDINIFIFFKLNVFFIQSGIIPISAGYS